MFYIKPIFKMILDDDAPFNLSFYYTQVFDFIN